MKKTVKFRADGSVQFIWSDELRPVFNEGDGAIRRASHVEPTPEGLWVADLAPVGGPALGPFTQRSKALSAEIKWLEANVIRG